MHCLLFKDTYIVQSEALSPNIFRYHVSFIIGYLKYHQHRWYNEEQKIATDPFNPFNPVSSSFLLTSVCLVLYEVLFVDFFLTF